MADRVFVFDIHIDVTSSPFPLDKLHVTWTAKYFHMSSPATSELWGDNIVVEPDTEPKKILEAIVAQAIVNPPSIYVLAKEDVIIMNMEKG